MTHIAEDARAFFQPLVDLPASTVVGFEALARFADGTPPPERLAQAEAAGVRDELEMALIELAVRTSVTLPEDAFVTLNASSSTMLAEGLDATLAGTTRAWGLELYEGSAVDESRAVRERISSLGAFLLIDDAGAGLADEKRIVDLRPDIVKIDRLLFWAALEDATERERVASLSRAASSVGARVLVEGIETADQVDAARELGAVLGQGYFLGRPTPPEDIPAVLAELQRTIGINTPGL